MFEVWPPDPIPPVGREQGKHQELLGHQARALNEGKLGHHHLLVLDLLEATTRAQLDRLSAPFARDRSEAGTGRGRRLGHRSKNSTCGA
jgi:hypothetical protein